MPQSKQPPSYGIKEGQTWQRGPGAQRPLSQGPQSQAH